MALQTAYTSQVFNFNFQARTSRGAMRERRVGLLKFGRKRTLRFMVLVSVHLCQG